MSVYMIAGHEFEVTGGELYLCGAEESGLVEDLGTAVPKLAALLSEAVAALAERGIALSADRAEVG